MDRGYRQIEVDMLIGHRNIIHTKEEKRQIDRNQKKKIDTGQRLQIDRDGYADKAQEHYPYNVDRPIESRWIDRENVDRQIESRKKDR